MPKISIIIPFQQVTPYLHETLDYIAKLKEKDFEVILLPDSEFQIKILKTYSYPIKIISTGPVSPAIKRDKGAEKSEGTFLAFIDDDAYPASDWLTKALPHFETDSVSAVGGPQMTPSSDTFSQKVSGAMFLSFLNGSAVYRYWPGQKSTLIDDWPSVNLIIRKNDFLVIGGFDNTYWPGEDTKLCLDITQKLGKKIIYEPRAKVFHHRRPGFFRHLKQTGNYGLHRGFFAKKFPENSRKLSYFIPSCFFIFCTLGWIALFSGILLKSTYISLWSLYITSLLLSTIGIYLKIKDISISAATIPYLTGTHFWYGFQFLKGFLFTNDLKSKLGR